MYRKMFAQLKKKLLVKVSNEWDKSFHFLLVNQENIGNNERVKNPPFLYVTVKDTSSQSFFFFFFGCPEKAYQI